MMQRLLCTALLSAGLLLPADAHAGLLRGLSLTDLCQRSAVIVRGKVVSRASAWRGGRIYTRVTLRVSQPLRGAHLAGQSVSFWRLGGRVGRYVQLVRGAPRFRVGDRVLVFLSRRAGRLFVTGMVQGRFFVQRPSGRQATVTQPLGGTRLTGRQRALTRPTSLRQFEQRIRATLTRLRRRRP